MFYVLTPAVTRKLNYDCDGLSYFQKVLSSLYFSSLTLSLLSTSVLHLANPLDPKERAEALRASYSSRTGEEAW
jgi:hypothetical protein